MAQPDLTQPDPTLIAPDDVIDGDTNLANTYSRTKLDQTVIVDGYGVVVRVARGQLDITDGIGNHQRTRRISRADAAAGKIRRVLILGEGTITTDATAWCAALGIALVVADRHGAQLSTTVVNRFNDGRLRRAQALAPHSDLAMDIATQLLMRRIGDQADIARHRLRRVDRADAIAEWLTALADASNTAEAMTVEMKAAGHYWAAWADEVTLRFATKDRRRVPDRWTRFNGRTSPLTQAMTNRHAADPTNALLNYGTRLAEIEATTFCHAIGLDPALGLLHATRNNRPALVLDMIEPARSVIEATVLELAEQRTFRKADFAELATGEVRVLAPLSHHLATALAPQLRDMLGPVVECVAQQLAGLNDSDLVVPTTLTRANSTASAPPRKQRGQNGPPAAPKQQVWSCPDCGLPVPNAKRVRCDTCVATDPRQTAEVRGRRSRAIAARRAADRAWTAGGGEGDYDPGDWGTIQVGLQGLKLTDIMAATGLSKSFASAVRSGKHRPHMSHWATLAQLSQDIVTQDSASGT
jgi:CRISP-associated protein Cas1